jgi:hypothetical protein
MKKKLLSFALGAMLFVGASAQDVDYTNLVVNNSFEYAWEGQVAQSGIDGWFSSTWRPLKATNTSYQKFYGWEVTDWNFRSSTNTSQSLESSGINRDLSFNIAIFGDKKFDEVWELYQIIDKDALPAGTYKIEARLAVRSDRRTTQRLFANQRVQYYGPETNYTKAQMTAGETATFAGWAAGNDELKDLVVYTTIGEEESLKFGIRTGGKKMDATMAGDNSTIYGCFKADYFRVTKLDPANPIVTDAALSSLSVEAVTGDCALVPAFDPEVTTYSCVLPKGTKSITPKLQTRFEAATFSGANAVDVSSGSGVSTIVVTAVDGVTTKTYTINYTYATTGPTDLTNLIINNSFDYADTEILLDANGDQVVDASIIGKDGNGWRVLNSTEKKFYGWTCDLSVLTGNSQGINVNPTNKHGNFAMWIGSSAVNWGDDWKLSQTISKANLGAGTYKLQARMAIDNSHTVNQRLFANQYVQYFRSESDYLYNRTAGEVNSFAGWTSNSQEALYEMKVYATITDDDDLEIGIRMGKTKGDGTTYTGGGSPMFKSDYFRLTKLDPADAANADLANITLSAGSLSFVPETNTYNVELPAESTSVTATATPAMEDVKVAGAGAVDVSSGSGVSTITVTALDGTTTKTYTINYSVGGTTNLKDVNANLSYRVADGRLSVYGNNAYTVYSLNGIKVAEVNNNIVGTSVALPQGVYIVKTVGGATKVAKVIVK